MQFFTLSSNLSSELFKTPLTAVPVQPGPETGVIGFALKSSQKGFCASKLPDVNANINVSNTSICWCKIVFILLDLNSLLY